MGRQHLLKTPCQSPALKTCPSITLMLCGWSHASIFPFFLTKVEFT